jgi:hypothetical protein
MKFMTCNDIRSENKMKSRYLFLLVALFSRAEASSILYSSGEHFVPARISFQSIVIPDGSAPGRTMTYSAYLGMTPEVDLMLSNMGAAAVSCDAKVTVQAVNLDRRMGMSANLTSLVKIWELKNCGAAE